MCLQKHKRQNAASVASCDNRGCKYTTKTSKIFVMAKIITNLLNKCAQTYVNFGNSA